MTEKARKLKSVDAQSVRARVTPEEWEVRCQLAAAYQLASQFRWTDLIFTHFTARVPGSHHILINPYGLMFDEITASSIVKIDHEGNVVDESEQVLTITTVYFRTSWRKMFTNVFPNVDVHLALCFFGLTLLSPDGLI